jgi:hypothetical protein
MLEDDRVRLFDQKLLRNLENKGYLEVPFIRPGSSAKRVADMCLTFPFGFWEAKREGGGYDHQSAQKQNAVKVKMILAWQEQVGKRAEVPWVPLVFYFVSVGSKFEVHGCHFEDNLFRRICVSAPIYCIKYHVDTHFIQVLRKLWSGDSANIDKALQLLYLVDIIALWGEHKYKPFAGACIRRLHAKAENEATPPLEETLLAHQVEINNKTFSWLSSEQLTTQASAASHLTSHQRSGKSRSHSQSRSQDPQSPNLLQEIRHLSLTSKDKDYIIPERDYFIWLLDRGIRGQDLLIVRIDEEGSVLPPLLVFDSATWGDGDFRLVVQEEQARLPKNISAEFRFSQDGRSFVKNCIARNPGYFREPQCQFCAIIPLDFKAYKRLLNAEDAGTAVFEELELLLRLPKLIDAAQDANSRWCQCQAIYNEHSPNMILCDNVKCPMGWYHKKCAGLHEDFSADCWLCSRCLDKWQGIETAVSEDELDDIDEGIREASDYRVQRIKTLARVWKDHKWPKPKKVRQQIDQISCRININERITYNTVRDTGNKPRCWAIERGSPKVMRAIRPAEGNSSLGPSKGARNPEHRNSDHNVPGVAAKGSMVQGRSSDQLTVAEWRGSGRRRSLDSRP